MSDPCFDNGTLLRGFNTGVGVRYTVTDPNGWTLRQFTTTVTETGGDFNLVIWQTSPAVQLNNQGPFNIPAITLAEACDVSNWSTHYTEEYFLPFGTDFIIGIVPRFLGNQVQTQFRTASFPEHPPELTFIETRYTSADNDPIDNVFIFTHAKTFSFIASDQGEPFTLPRISSAAKEDVVIETVLGLTPVDGSYSEVFPPHHTLDYLEQQDFFTIMRHPEASLKKFNYPVNDLSFANAYEGTTQLERLKAEAPRVLVKLSELSVSEDTSANVQSIIEAIQADLTTDPDDGEAKASLKLAIQYFNALCAEKYPWFSAETPPAFHHATLGESKEIRIPALFIPQLEGSKASIKDVYDEVLSFAPAVLRQNKSGRIQFVPLYGPDAYTNSIIQLVESDIVAPLFEPKINPRNVYNAAQVRVKGLTFVAGQEVLQPSYLVIAADEEENDQFAIPAGFTPIDGGNNDGIQRGALGSIRQFRFTMPVLDTETLIGGSFIVLDLNIEAFGRGVTNPFTSLGTSQSEYQAVTLTAGATAGDNVALTVNALSYALPVGRKIIFDNDVATVSIAAAQGATSVTVATLTLDRLAADVGYTSSAIVSVDGTENLNLITVSENFLLQTFRLVLAGLFDSSQNAIILRAVDADLFHINLLDAAIYGYFEIQARAYGSKYTQSNTEIVGEFGYNESDTLPNVGGSGDALADSRAIWGTKALTVSSNHINLTAIQAAELAQAIVLERINPKKRWNFQLTAAGQARGPDFDDIGQKGALPTTLPFLVEGVWQGLRYRDSSTYNQLSIFQEAVLAETFRVYDDNPDTGLQYLCDFLGDVLCDFEGNFLIDFEAVNEDLTTTAPAPADPTPVTVGDVEGFAGQSNDADWNNASVTTVANESDLRTQLAVAGTNTTPRIVRMTANITLGGDGVSNLPTMGDYVCFDLNGLQLLGGSAIPDYEDNTSVRYAAGPILGNYCRVINGYVGYLYDGLRCRNSKTGWSIENIRFLYCQDENIGIFGDASGNPTSRGSVLDCTFGPHPSDSSQYSHPVLIQSDSYTMTNTYVTMARNKFLAECTNRLPLSKGGANVHIYGQVNYNSQSGSGHMGIENNSESFVENSVFYDNSVGNGGRVFVPDSSSKVRHRSNYFRNYARPHAPSQTLSRLSSIPYAYTVHTSAIDIENNAGSSFG